MIKKVVTNSVQSETFPLKAFSMQQKFEWQSPTAQGSHEERFLYLKQHVTNFSTSQGRRQIDRPENC